jgi:predicted transposase YdaD
LVLLIPPAVKKLKEQGRVEGRAEGRVEGRVEGRAEERAEWEAWLMRRNEAEANNQPFDEPSPSQRQ